MRDKPCFLCGSVKRILLHKGVRDNADIDVLRCCGCDLVFLSSFENIDESFYNDSKMWETKSFEAWQLSTMPDDLRRYEQYKNDVCDKNIIDYGCGNGGFLRLASQSAKTAIGVELDVKASSYIKSKLGIDVFSSSTSIPFSKKYDYDPDLNTAYTSVLSKNKACDTLICSISK